jgi:hypothetical protein
MRFGGRSWRDISCREFLLIPKALADGMVWTEAGRRHRRAEGEEDGADDACPWMKRGDPDAVSYETMESFISWEIEAFLGHPPCVAEDATRFGPENWWVYGGSCPWEPSEFQTMLDLMATGFEGYRQEISLWNEVVAARPAQERDAITAVFYAARPGLDAGALGKARAIAELEAQRLGGKPVLLMDLVGYGGEGGAYVRATIYLCLFEECQARRQGVGAFYHTTYTREKPS